MSDYKTKGLNDSPEEREVLQCALIHRLCDSHIKIQAATELSRDDFDSMLSYMPLASGEARLAAGCLHRLMYDFGILATVDQDSKILALVWIPTGENINEDMTEAMWYADPDHAMADTLDRMKRTMAQRIQKITDKQMDSVVSFVNDILKEHDES